MPSRILTHDLFPHGVVQTSVFAAAAAVPASPWAAMLAAIVGAISTWALQQLSKGLWRQIATLEARVAELENLRCPLGAAAAARCQAAPQPPPAAAASAPEPAP